MVRASPWNSPLRVSTSLATSARSYRLKTSFTSLRTSGRSISMTCSLLDVLPLAEGDVAQRARYEELLDLEAARSQSLLMRILQQCLDRRPVLRNSIWIPVTAD